MTARSLCWPTCQSRGATTTSTRTRAASAAERGRVPVATWALPPKASQPPLTPAPTSAGRAASLTLASSARWPAARTASARMAPTSARWGAGTNAAAQWPCHHTANTVPTPRRSRTRAWSTIWVVRTVAPCTRSLLCLLLRRRLHSLILGLDAARVAHTSSAIGSATTTLARPSAWKTPPARTTLTAGYTRGGGGPEPGKARGVRQPAPAACLSMRGLPTVAPAVTAACTRTNSAPQRPSPAVLMIRGEVP